MTAEPRDVEEIRTRAIEYARGHIESVGGDEALVGALARGFHDGLAAADRENAELRGEVERLREGYRVVCDQAERADLLQFQLAAAQAQLAEAEALLSTMGDTLAAAEARLEAVRALHRSDAYARPTCLGCGREWPCPTEEAMQAAALSAAPQPEPVVAPYETPEEAAANDAIPAEPISPEFRQRLIAAVERPLRVRRAILLLAGHASGHLPGFDRGCRVCRRDWPCEDTQRAAAPALEAFADVTPEPPASDEPTGRSD